MQKIIHTKHKDIKPYITRDGSIIYELMHPLQHGNQNQSLAEAIVPAHTSTFLHLHHKTEELYHVIEGEGFMTLGSSKFPIKEGDTILIKPQTPHSLEAQNEDLKVLCCCSPAYSHEDTKLL